MGNQTNGKSLGRRLKIIRTAREMTLQEVANRLGVTTAFLSMVENGKSGIALNTMQRLLHVYGTTISEFYREPVNKGKVIRLAEARLLPGQEHGVESRLLRSERDPPGLEPIHFRLQPGSGIDYLQHEGVEFALVLRGELTVMLIDPDTSLEETHVLQGGDVLHFRSNWPHHCENRAPELCEFLAVASEETF